MTRRSLRLEYLEDRLTPATKMSVPLLPPLKVQNTTSSLIAASSTTTTATTGWHSVSAPIGVTLDSGGSTGTSGSSGGGGLGTSTGNPVGPGPGS